VLSLVVTRGVMRGEDLFGQRRGETRGLTEGEEKPIMSNYEGGRISPV